MPSSTDEHNPDKAAADLDGPLFTQAEEKKEKAEMTDADKSDAVEAMYGQVHPSETPEKVASSLARLETELDGLPSEEKAGWERAKERCPDLVDEKHRLMFLRCEVFNADLAARRLTKYWDRRVEIFGPEKAFQPLTLDQAMKDDDVALSLSFFRSTERTDSAGRRILFGDPSKLDKSKYERKSMVRASWYVIHAALEDETTQKKGVVMILCPRNSHIGQLDRKLMGMNAESIKGMLPVRVGAFHICHPPAFFTAVFQIVKYVLGKRLRARIKVHSGSDEHVLDRLAEYGIPKDSIPSDIGGNIVLDHERWLKDRSNSGL